MTAKKCPCRFRRETAADRLLLDAWLPADRARGVAFVGETAGAPGRAAAPVAAFAVAPPVERPDPPGLALALHVIPAHRGRGIEDHVLDLADRMAAAAAGRALYAWPHPEAGSDAARFYGSLGFAAYDTWTVWGVESIRARERMAPLTGYAEAVADRGARVVPLADADAADVLRLWETELSDQGARRADALARLRGEGDDAFDLDLSRALMVGDRLSGILLMRRVARLTWEASALVVAPGLRHGWAPLLLLSGVWRAAEPKPGEMLRFSALQRHRPTHSLARRFGARVLERRLFMRRDAAGR